MAYTSRIYPIAECMEKGLLYEPCLSDLRPRKREDEEDAYPFLDLKPELTDFMKRRIEMLNRKCGLVIETNTGTMAREEEQGGVSVWQGEFCGDGI